MMNYENYCLTTSLVLGRETENWPMSFIKTHHCMIPISIVQWRTNFQKLESLKSTVEVFEKMLLCLNMLFTTERSKCNTQYNFDTFDMYSQH